MKSLSHLVGVVALVAAACSPSAGPPTTAAASTTTVASEGGTSVPEPTTTTMTAPTTTTPPTTTPAAEVVGTTFTWHRVEGGPDEVPFGHVVSVPGGFAVVEAATGPEGDALWTSRDGLVWDRADLPVDATRPLLTRVGDTYWLISAGFDGGAMWRSDDFENWTEVAVMSGAQPLVQPWLDISDQPIGNFDVLQPQGSIVTDGEQTYSKWVDAAGFEVGVLVTAGGTVESVTVPWSATGGQRAGVATDPAGHIRAYETFEDVGRAWLLEDGAWVEAGPIPMWRDPVTGEWIQSLQVVGGGGTMLTQTGFFCGVGQMWRSSDGVEWELLGDSPDRGEACGGVLLPYDRGWVFVTDGGEQPPSPDVWLSETGDSWERLDLDALDITVGDGSSPRFQSMVSTAADGIFIQSLGVDRRTMWVGRRWDSGMPAAHVEFGADSCRASLPALGSTAVDIDIENGRDLTVALVMGAYQEGFGHADLVAYGPDVSTRPPFLDALEIFEVAPGTTRSVSFDHGPGRFFVVCMDTTETMIVLDDMVIEDAVTP